MYALFSFEPDVHLAKCTRDILIPGACHMSCLLCVASEFLFLPADCLAEALGFCHGGSDQCRCSWWPWLLGFWVMDRCCLLRLSPREVYIFHFSVDQCVLLCYRFGWNAASSCLFFLVEAAWCFDCCGRLWWW
jgi:hypothetical protein